MWADRQPQAAMTDWAPLDPKKPVESLSFLVGKGGSWLKCSYLFRDPEKGGSFWIIHGISHSWDVICSLYTHYKLETGPG